MVPSASSTTMSKWGGGVNKGCSRHIIEMRCFCLWFLSLLSLIDFNFSLVFFSQYFLFSSVSFSLFFFGAISCLLFFYISSFIFFFSLTGFCSFGIFGEVTEFSSVEKYCHIGWKVLTIFGWFGGTPRHHSPSQQCLKYWKSTAQNEANTSLVLLKYHLVVVNKYLQKTLPPRPLSLPLPSYRCPTKTWRAYWRRRSFILLYSCSDNIVSQDAVMYLLKN